MGENSADKKLSERLNDPIVTRTLLSLETLLDDKLKQGRKGGTPPVAILNYLDLGNSLHVTDFLRPFGPGNARIFFNPLFFIGNLISAMCLNPYGGDFQRALPPRQMNFNRRPSGPDIWGDMARFKSSGYIAGGDKIRMAPLPGEPLPEDCRIVVLSENGWDSSIYSPVKKAKSAAGAFLRCPGPALPKGGLIIVGVNPKLPFILQGLGKPALNITIADNQTEKEFGEWYGEYSRTPEGVSFRECRFRSEKMFRMLDLAGGHGNPPGGDGHLLNSSTPTGSMPRPFRNCFC